MHLEGPKTLTPVRPHTLSRHFGSTDNRWLTPLVYRPSSLLLRLRMLEELQDIHAELREAIAALAEITSQLDPDVEALSAARLRLSRLSRRRRALIEYSILPALKDTAAVDKRAISDLTVETAEQSVRSSEHVSRWTLSVICGDWAGYKRASAEMRREMLRKIEREGRIIYPLLATEPIRNS